MSVHTIKRPETPLNEWCYSIKDTNISLTIALHHETMILQKYKPMVCIGAGDKNVLTHHIYTPQIVIYLRRWTGLAW